MTFVSRRALLRMIAASASDLAVRPAFSSAVQRVLFEPIPAEQSGITWRHVSGRSPDYYLPETTGAGCAFFDYDNDGWMDIYLVNSGECDFYLPAKPLRNALYRNNRDGTFSDVTLQAGVAGGGYGMGVAAADYNGDGFTDLFVTGYNRCFLYRNNGNGTFTDVTEAAGLKIDGWATSAVWFDYDNDGRLDLFVCRFAEFSKKENKFCGDSVSKERHYCVPRIYPGAPSWLFHNNGDGTFSNVSEAAGIHTLQGKAWGVVATDINNDGWTDLFVANDTVQNFLLVNHGGKFRDEGLEAGVAYSIDGLTRSGMGVDSADLDQDGWQDLFLTNIDHELYSLYHNRHDGTFDDLATNTCIASASRNMSGWGVRLFDYDNDGNLDIFVADGHPDDQIALTSSTVTYREPLLLIHNDGKTLRNVSSSAGPIFREPMAARGLAIGDFDNNGAVDVLIAVNNGAPVLLRNKAAQGNHWLGIRLVGKTANAEGLGARITWTAGDLTRSCLKTSGGSFLSSHDPRLVLGLGPHATVGRLEIRWPRPSTKVDILTNLATDRYVTIVEGQGMVRGQ